MFNYRSKIIRIEDREGKDEISLESRYNFCFDILDIVVYTKKDVS